MTLSAVKTPSCLLIRTTTWDVERLPTEKSASNSERMTRRDRSTATLSFGIAKRMIWTERIPTFIVKAQLMRNREFGSPKKR